MSSFVPLSAYRLFTDTFNNSPPPVEVSTNDTYILHATNHLDVPTAIHHHGMFFNSTPWYDGAMQVTQW
jgi:FtsP/CotA-like multicopper oxidase with cupredoxin domain